MTSAWPHVAFLDGVYAAARDGGIAFRPLSHLSTTETLEQQESELLV